MLYLVTGKVRDTVLGEAAAEMRRELAERIPAILASDKVRAAGVVAMKRKMFLVIDVEHMGEIAELIGPKMVDNAEIDIQPAMTLDELLELFKSLP